MKYYDYYYEAYEAVLGGLVGEYEIQEKAENSEELIWVKKYGLKRFRDPSQYGLCNHYETAVEERSTFPQIIDSHRMNVGSLRELKWRRSKCGRVVDKVKNKIINC